MFLQRIFLLLSPCFSAYWLSPFVTMSSCRGPGDVIGDCKIQFLDEIYQLEKPGARPLSSADGQFKRTYEPDHIDSETQLKTPTGSFHNESEDVRAYTCMLVPPGKSGPECKHCKADPDTECRFCSCCVCGGKQDAHMQLLCDECNMAFHIYCLNPPLTTIPDDEDWWETECNSAISYKILQGW